MPTRENPLPGDRSDDSVGEDRELVTGETLVSDVTETVVSSNEYEAVASDGSFSANHELRVGTRPNHRHRPALDEGTQLGRLVVEERLGRGGMGQVLQAYDEALLRHVAVKIMHREGADNVEQRARFLAEAQITAQLEHPSVVPIYDIETTDDGRPYIVLKKVEGQSLREILHLLLHDVDDARETWTSHRLLGIFLKVANAVAYAHERRILHRDLKPENIMVGAFGEVLLLDWGVAGRIGEGDDDVIIDDSGVDHVSVARLVDGSVIGTPGYMSPEQCRGEITQLDERSDIWSLGSILYEIVCYRPAFDASTPVELMVRTLEGCSVPPRERAPALNIASELEAICEKAMALEPDDRFESVLEMAAAVERFLEGSRRREEASRWVEKAGGVWSTFLELGEKRDALMEQEKRLADAANAWAPISDKRELIEVRDTLAALEPRRARVFGEFVALCEKALAYDSEHAGARKALADGYWQRLEEAEARRDPADVVYFADRVAAYDDGSYAALLEGTGSLTLRTEPPGARVTLERFENKGLVRPLVDRERLGETPIIERSLPMGSYLLTIEHDGKRDTRYPVYIDRGRSWNHSERPIPLYSDAEIGEKFVYVPAGPFILGGDAEAPGSGPRRRVEVDGFFLARFPVTMEDYCEFLNAVHERDPAEAWQRAPRSEAGLEESHGQYFERPRPGERYVLPEKDREGNPWDPLWPVFGVNWYDAVAYTEWASERDGVEYRLPYENELEKAARGVDGRFYPWGDRFDRTLCKMGDSRRGRARPEMIGAFPNDVSVYGARDIAGSMRDWCADTSFNGDSTLRPVRGGSWNYDPRFCRAACRLGRAPWRVFSYNGFRLARTEPLQDG